MRYRRTSKGIAIERGAIEAAYPDRWKVLTVGRFWAGFHLRRLTHAATVTQVCAGPILYMAVKPPRSALAARRRMAFRPDW